MRKSHNTRALAEARTRLQHSEELFRLSFEYANIGICLVNLDGTFIKTNRRMSDIFGYAAEEFAGMTVNDLALPAYKHVSSAFIEKAIAGETAHAEFDKQYVHKDGHVVWGRVSSSLVRNAQGAPAYFISHIQDITAAKQAEQELQETKAILQAAMDQSQAGIAIADAPDGKLRYVNDAGLLIRGGSKQEIVNGVGIAEYVASWQILHLDGTPYRADEVPLARAILHGEKCSREFIVRRANNDDRIVWANAAPILDEHGKILAGIVVFLDITDRKRLEEKTTWLASFPEKNPNPIVEITLDGTPSYLNPSARQLFPDLPDADCQHPFLAGMEQILAMFRQGNTAQATRDVTLGGFWYQQTISYVKESRTVRIYGTDITERKLADNALQKTLTELEAKNAELEKFTYTVSHDLKSPLITIKGFLGQMTQDIAASRFDRLTPDLRRIANAADKMDALLQDVLALSRIGRFVNPASTFSMADVAREAIEMVDGCLQAKQIRLIEDPSMPVVCADRMRMREVWQNLLENAVKYMGDQPTPEIRIGWKRSTATEFLFCVQDNGIGVKPDYHAKIFGIFEKLDSRTEGTGIGLALVKRIIEFHGGTVWVESQGDGQGSTFYFTLPNKEKNA